MKIDVYGKEVEVIQSGNDWVAFYPGNDGKKRNAEDIKIPAGIKQSEVVVLIADLCHEWARPGHREVEVLKY